MSRPSSAHLMLSVPGQASELTEEAQLEMALAASAADAAYQAPAGPSAVAFAVPVRPQAAQPPSPSPSEPQTVAPFPAAPSYEQLTSGRLQAGRRASGHDHSTAAPAEPAAQQKVGGLPPARALVWSDSSWSWQGNGVSEQAIQFDTFDAEPSVSAQQGWCLTA